MPHFTKYPLPFFLSGTLTPSAYNKFLTNRARGLLFRDKKHKKPYAFTSSKAEYRSLIHDAVVRNGQTDPDVLGLETQRPAKKQ